MRSFEEFVMRPDVMLTVIAFLCATILSLVFKLYDCLHRIHDLEKQLEEEDKKVDARAKDHRFAYTVLKKYR